jgi:hypothetical protein
VVRTDRADLVGKIKSDCHAPKAPPSEPLRCIIVYITAKALSRASPSDAQNLVCRGYFVGGGTPEDVQIELRQTPPLMGKKSNVPRHSRAKPTLLTCPVKCQTSLKNHQYPHDCRSYLHEFPGCPSRASASSLGLAFTSFQRDHGRCLQTQVQCSKRRSGDVISAKSLRALAGRLDLRVYPRGCEPLTCTSKACCRPRPSVSIQAS